MLWGRLFQSVRFVRLGWNTAALAWHCAVACDGDSGGVVVLTQLKEYAMKRLILASALSAVALSASALEIGAPYEQLNIDRQLPNIEFAPVAPYVAGSRAPFEQLAIDRALPNLPVQNAQFAQVAGSTRSGASAGGDVPAKSPWAHHWNFIAPP